MKVTLFLCVSLDGFITTSDGSSAWPEGAWQDWCEFCTSADNLVLGRVSYSGLIKHDFSDLLRPNQKVVISSQEVDTSQSDWTHVRTPEEAIKHMKACDIANMVVGGGRQVANAFLTAGLIDEIVLDVQPVVFGAGVPLLGRLEKPIELELLEDKPLDHDAIRLRYRVSH